MVLEKKIFKFSQCIFAILFLSLLGNGWDPSFEQTWIPFIQGCFVPSLVDIGPIDSSMYFRYFVIISPSKRAGPFVWTNLNPLYPKSLVEIGPVVLEKRMKLWKVYKQTDGRWTTGESTTSTLTSAFSVGRI